MKNLIYSVLVVLVLSTSGMAYLDPSVMTYLIQSIAGIVIAVGAVFAIHYHKLKKKVNKVLKVDENSKKEEEEELVVFEKDK